MRQIFFIILLIIFLISCKKKSYVEAELIVKKWTGREIVFPENFKAYYLGKDTTYDCVFDREYKILLYVDSIGCTSCRLGLYNWYQRILEMEKLVPGKVGFIFFMQPKEDGEKQIEYLCKRDNFKHPIFIDHKDEINRLNKFEKNPSYQCFLLNSKNKVIAVGNPQENYYIWNFFKEVVSEIEIQNLIPQKTLVEIEQQNIEVMDMEINETTVAVFKMRNIGTEPMLVYHIETTCGCIVPEWDKKPIMPGNTLEVTVHITPEKKGFLNKNLYMYINAGSQRFKFNIYGNVK